MQNLPLYVSITFVLSTLYAVFMFVKAGNGNKTLLIVLLTWIALQGFIGLTGFYTKTTGLPPRFTFIIIPTLISIILLFISSAGRNFLDGLNLQTLTLLHLVRIPVEIVLFWLFTHEAVPLDMTFKGSNPDILSGITAGIVYVFTRKNTNRRILLAWNIVCLGLLLNIVTIAVLAAPFNFQQIAFDQPNIAIIYFPYVWLPAVIVPLVLLSHLATIRQLFLKNSHTLNRSVPLKNQQVDLLH